MSPFPNREELESIEEGMPRVGAETSAFIHPLGIGLVSAPYVRHAFMQLLGSGVLETFPKLRVAFLEAGSEWAVGMTREVETRWRKKVGDLLGSRAFISCKVTEDIPYLVEKLGKDFLITAADFPHGDINRQDKLVDGVESTVSAVIRSTAFWVRIPVDSTVRSSARRGEEGARAFSEGDRDV